MTGRLKREKVRVIVGEIRCGRVEHFLKRLLTIGSILLYIHILFHFGTDQFQVHPVFVCITSKCVQKTFKKG